MVGGARGRAARAPAWSGPATGRRPRFRSATSSSSKIEQRGSDGILEVSLDQDPEVEGALVAIEPETGYVRAMVGGYDFQRSQFNRAAQALRQPGSAFKPFVYAAAIDRGFTPASIVVDAPISFDDGSNKVWTPRTTSRSVHGPTRLREALAHSLNVDHGEARAGHRARLPDRAICRASASSARSRATCRSRSAASEVTLARAGARLRRVRDGRTR